jgi:AraC-like DNA-binding protein
VPAATRRKLRKSRQMNERCFLLDRLEIIVGGKCEMASQSTLTLTSHSSDYLRQHYRGGLSGRQLRRALEFIDANATLKLTADTIAGAVGLSKYHFGKAFKQSTGVTLHSYVLARRVCRSKELLAYSDLPLAAVAQSAGFSSQSHFTAMFSTRMGISPGSYRSLNRPRLSPCIAAAQRRT